MIYNQQILQNVASLILRKLFDSINFPIKHSDFCPVLANKAVSLFVIFIKSDIIIWWCGPAPIF